MSNVIGESSSFPMINTSDLSWIPLVDGTATEITGNANNVRYYAFYQNPNIVSVNLPLVSNIEHYAFWGCENLTTALFEHVSTISQNAFGFCVFLENTNFPNVTHIGHDAFYGCSCISAISLPMCTAIEATAFQNCRRLISLYLIGSSICTLGVNALSATPIGGDTSLSGQYGSIYVPASLYSDYISATNWSLFASRIVSV